jgi:Stf0 sulfotransferase
MPKPDDSPSLVPGLRNAEKRHRAPRRTPEKHRSRRPPRGVLLARWRYAGDSRNAGGEPRFDLATLDHLVAEIAEHNHSWQEWFAEQEATPLCLTYELVAKEPTTAARMVLDFLDLRTDVPPCRPNNRPTR